MKSFVSCIAIFLAMIFAFSCGRERIFEKNEDFESGKLTETLFGPGAGGTTVWIVSSPERVVSGKFSAYSKAEPYRGEWWLFLYSDRKKLPLERKGVYTVTFKYKAIEAPNVDGFYLFLVRTNAGFDSEKGFVNDRAFTTWSDVAGAVGTKRIDFTLGDFDDYYLIWGIHNRGAISIDDIKVAKRNERN